MKHFMQKLGELAVLGCGVGLIVWGHSHGSSGSCFVGSVIAFFAALSLLN